MYKFEEMLMYLYLILCWAHWWWSLLYLRFRASQGDRWPSSVHAIHGGSDGSWRWGWTRDVSLCSSGNHKIEIWHS